MLTPCVELSYHEYMVGMFSGAAKWHKARARGEGGGPNNGKFYENQAGTIAELALAKWASSCCCLVLWRKQADVPGDIGSEPGCGWCRGCGSDYHEQVKSITNPQDNLSVKRRELIKPSEKEKRFWLAYVDDPYKGFLNHEDYANPVVVFFLGYQLGSFILRNEEFCDRAEAKYPWESGENTRKYFLIYQEELIKVAG